MQLFSETYMHMFNICELGGYEVGLIEQKGTCVWVISWLFHD